MSRAALDEHALCVCARHPWVITDPADECSEGNIIPEEHDSSSLDLLIVHFIVLTRVMSECSNRTLAVTISVIITTSPNTVASGWWPHSPRVV
eukprot:1679834-Amphidinium_carterae.1